VLQKVYAQDSVRGSNQALSDWKVFVPVVAKKELADKGLGRMFIHLLLGRANIKHPIESASNLIDVAAFVAEE
jgi:hypothetical protein